MEVPQQKDATGRFIAVRRPGLTDEDVKDLALIEEDLDKMLKDRLIEPEHRDTAKLLLCAMNFGCKNLGRLSAISGLPRDRVVRPVAQRLRDSGVWSDDGRVCWEYPPHESKPEYTNIEFVLHVLCAEGEIKCVHRDPLPWWDGNVNAKEVAVPKFDALFAWRIKMLPRTATPEILIESLTCEGLSTAATPKEFYEDVVNFRHLNQRARLGAARRYFASVVGAGGVK